MSKEVSAFCKSVYDAVSKIPKGKVTTYGALARKLNSAPRAIGQALKKNPFAPKVPCHRVVKSDGSIGGFMGESSGLPIKNKIELLKKEGVNVNDGHIRLDQIVT